MSWSREEILSATRGEVIQEGEERVFGEIITDSRQVGKGAVFVALVGERLDGHAFLEGAVRRGASCLVVHQQPAASLGRGATVIMVRDTLEALGEMAHYRREAVAPKVLAITGSNGKTTTREMVAAILEQASLQGRPLRGKVLKTERNYNNLVGLPLTLLRLCGREEVVVLELGSNRPGEIRRLAQIADPDIGLITSVAPAHLEGLRSLAGVGREKGALFQEMRPGGIAVVNLDDPWVSRLGKRFQGHKVTYGRKGMVRGESWRPLGEKGMEFTLRIGQERCRIRLKLCGRHHLDNAVAAAAMAHGLGVELGAMRRGLERVRPFPMRMEIGKWRGIGLINDAYNANPASMAAALKALAQLPRRGEKVAILGDMLELGGASRKSHRELGREVARRRVDRLYLLGREAGHVKEGALLGGMAEERVIVGKGHEEIAETLRGHVKRGDWLLFKGSRAMNMERVLTAFQKRETGG